MANTKKIKSERKRTKTFSVKNKILDEFLDICDVKGLVPSNEAEKLIESFNNSHR